MNDVHGAELQVSDANFTFLKGNRVRVEWTATLGALGQDPQYRDGVYSLQTFVYGHVQGRTAHPVVVGEPCEIATPFVTRPGFTHIYGVSLFWTQNRTAAKGTQATPRVLRGTARTCKVPQDESATGDERLVATAASVAYGISAQRLLEQLYLNRKAMDRHHDHQTFSHTGRLSSHVDDMIVEAAEVAQLGTDWFEVLDDLPDVLRAIQREGLHGFRGR